MFRVLCSCSYLFTFLLSSRFYWHIRLNQQLTFSTHPVLSRRRERQLCVGRKPCGLRDGSELTICHCQSTNSNNYSADSRKARRRTNSNGDDICFCVVIRRLGWRIEGPRDTPRQLKVSHTYIRTYIRTYSSVFRAQPTQPRHVRGSSLQNPTQRMILLTQPTT